MEKEVEVKRIFEPMEVMQLEEIVTSLNSEEGNFSMYDSLYQSAVQNLKSIKRDELLLSSPVSHHPFDDTS